MPTENDLAWLEYVNAKGIHFDQPSYLVDATELKNITKREPRLLAKFDTPDQLPEPLARAGYTLFPIKNGQYQLARGNLFVDVPECPPSMPNFHPSTPFPLLTLARGNGESQFIDLAYHTGLLGSFLNIPQMYLTIRGRERTGSFEFELSDHLFRVDGVQIEVDAGFEAHYDIVLVEAKVEKVDKLPQINVRQLYFPYRHFSAIVPNKQVRSVLLAYDKASTTYHLVEYTFKDSKNPRSATVLQCIAFQLVPPTQLEIDALRDAHFRTYSDIVPQADDLNKIVQLVEIVDDGNNTSALVADYFGFDLRQSSYYREAAEYLGLMEFDSNNLYSLTPLGSQLLLQSIESYPRFLAKLVVNSWIFVELIQRARTRGAFSVDDIDSVIQSVQKSDGAPRYSGDTVRRRRQTIVAWIGWLTNQFGCFVEISPHTYRLR